MRSSSFHFGELGTRFVRAQQVSPLSGCVAFMEHGNGLLHEFVDTFVGAALDVLFDQFLKFRPKADFHGSILTYE